ncbi:MAG: hypothetical protein ACK5WS_02505, partial [Alphaproteobacteria bacterium]
MSIKASLFNKTLSITNNQIYIHDINTFQYHVMLNTFSLLWGSLKSASSKFLEHKDLLLILIAVYSFCTAKAQEPAFEMMMEYVRHLSATDSAFNIDEWTARAQNMYWDGSNNFVSLVKYLLFLLSIGLIYRFPKPMDLRSTFDVLLDIAKSKILSLAALCIMIWIATFVGFMALIIPGVYIALITAVAAPVLMLEDKDSIDSLKRSNGLMSGHKTGFLLFYAAMWL